MAPVMIMKIAAKTIHPTQPEFGWSSTYSPVADICALL